MQMSAGAHGGQKRISNILGMEWQVIMNHPDVGAKIHSRPLQEQNVI